MVPALHSQSSRHSQPPGGAALHTVASDRPRACSHFVEMAPRLRESPASVRARSPARVMGGAKLLYLRLGSGAACALRQFERRVTTPPVSALWSLKGRRGRNYELMRTGPPGTRKADSQPRCVIMHGARAVVASQKIDTRRFHGILAPPEAAPCRLCLNPRLPQSTPRPC